MTVPRFSSEAAEAEWWFEHRDELAEVFEKAAAQGELTSGTAARISHERASGTSILLDPEDISRARALALKRGLHYDAYLKRLLHDALAAEEGKLAS